MHQLHQTDELPALPGEGAAQPRALWQQVAPRTLLVLAMGAAVVALVAYATLRNAGAERRVPLAVPAASATAAGRAVEAAGIRVDWRDGHPWVATADAQRAAQAAAQANTGRAARPAVQAEESPFLSTEAARARRMAGTMAALEDMVRAHAGVTDARVVLAEGSRPGAPGSAYSGPTGAVTVTMESGEMSQDLVDAVAGLVSGAVPGLPADRVTVIDARANRQRTPRTVAERQAQEQRRERERTLAEQLQELLPELPNMRVSVNLDTPSTPRALIRGGMGSVDPEAVRAQAEVILCEACGGVLPQVTVVAEGPSADPSPLRIETAGAQDAMGQQVAAAVTRERATPLGPSPGAANAGGLTDWLWPVLAFAAVGAGAWYWRRVKPAPASAEAGTELESHAADEDTTEDEGPAMPAHAAASAAVLADASDAVRAEPTQAVHVVRGWLDAGLDTRAAELVVALDAGAAGALLRAMPQDVVNRVTGALADLHTPTAQDLTDACSALTEEMSLVPEEAA